MVNQFIASTCANEIAKRSDLQISKEGACSECGSTKNLYQYQSDSICSPCFLFRKPLPMFTKDNKITIKQKDTILILREDKSYVMGDINLPTQTDDKVQIVTPDITNKWRDFLAQYIVEEHDPTKTTLLIIQSKADKTNTFTLSQGDILSICGQMTADINTKLIKKLSQKLTLAPTLKRENLNSYSYHLAHSLWLDNDTQTNQLISINKKLAALEKKFPVLAEIKNDLPMNNSDDMQMLSWCLSR